METPEYDGLICFLTLLLSKWFLGFLYMIEEKFIPHIWYKESWMFTPATLVAFQIWDFIALAVRIYVFWRDNYASTSRLGLYDSLYVYGIFCDGT